MPLRTSASLPADCPLCSHLFSTAILRTFTAIGTAFTTLLADKAAAKRGKTVDVNISLRILLVMAQAARSSIVLEA